MKDTLSSDKTQHPSMIRPSPQMVAHMESPALHRLTQENHDFQTKKSEPQNVTLSQKQHKTIQAQ